MCDVCLLLSMSRLIESSVVRNRIWWLRTGATRGQLNGKYIIGGLILLVIANPLLNAVAQLQAGFASTPAFSEIEAAVVAVLFGAVIVAALFDE